MLAITTAVLVVGAGRSTAVSAQAATPGQAGLRKIVALGDSLTSGHGLLEGEAYPAVLNRMLRDANLPYTLINHGVAGDTTSGGLRRLAAALAEKPDILIVALGANDGLRGIPVDRVRRNLESILEAARARGVPVLLCGMDALPVHGWQYTIDFHNIFPELAAKYSVPLVPFLLEGVFLNERMLQPDFAHPNAAGAAHIARTIWTYLEPMATTLLSRR